MPYIQHIYRSRHKDHCASKSRQRRRFCPHISHFFPHLRRNLISKNSRLVYCSGSGRDFVAPFFAGILGSTFREDYFQRSVFNIIGILADCRGDSGTFILLAGDGCGRLAFFDGFSLYASRAWSGQA